MRIAKDGYPLILTAGALTILAFLLGWRGVGIVLGLATLAIIAFFRDPERNIPTGEGLIVSPADGRVVSIAEVRSDSSFGDMTTRVSIFLSPLDVHINRMPAAGKIDDVRYQDRRQRRSVVGSRTDRRCSGAPDRVPRKTWGSIGTR